MHHPSGLWPCQSLRQLPPRPSLASAHRPATLRSTICRSPNAAQLRSAHRLTAALRLATSMLGLGLIGEFMRISDAIGEIEVERLKESRSMGLLRSEKSFSLEIVTKPLVMASEIAGLEPL